MLEAKLKVKETELKTLQDHHTASGAATEASVDDSGTQDRLQFMEDKLASQMVEIEHLKREKKMTEEDCDHWKKIVEYMYGYERFVYFEQQAGDSLRATDSKST